MPYQRPGIMKYATATKNTWHGAPCIEGGGSGDAFIGVAVKQKAASAGAASGTPQSLVAIGEEFAIISKGVVQIDAALVSTPAVGDKLYITVATNALSKSASGTVPFGLVTELGGTRGTPTGKIRVDLDAKAQF